MPYEAKLAQGGWPALRYLNAPATRSIALLVRGDADADRFADFDAAAAVGGVDAEDHAHGPVAVFNLDNLGAVRCVERGDIILVRQAKCDLGLRFARLDDLARRLA